MGLYVQFFSSEVSEEMLLIVMQNSEVTITALKMFSFPLYYT